MNVTKTQRLPALWLPTRTPTTLPDTRRRYPRDTASLATTTRIPVLTGR